MISRYDDKIQPIIFDKQLNNISISKWNELYSNLDYSVIGRFRIKNVLISTLWTGISVSKLPFESCIFVGNDCIVHERHADQEEAELYFISKVEFYISLDKLGGLPEREASNEKDHS